MKPPLTSIWSRELPVSSRSAAHQDPPEGPSRFSLVAYRDQADLLCLTKVAPASESLTGSAMHLVRTDQVRRSPCCTKAAYTQQGWWYRHQIPAHSRLPISRSPKTTKPPAWRWSPRCLGTGVARRMRQGPVRLILSIISAMFRVPDPSGGMAPASVPPSARRRLPPYRYQGPVAHAALSSGERAEQGFSRRCATSRPWAGPPSPRSGSRNNGRRGRAR